MRTTVLPPSVTAVCANSLPLALEPVFSVIAVIPRTTPSKCAVVPMSTMPADCQKTFCASAPPCRNTLVPEAWVMPPAIWKIQTSFAPPLSVTFVGMVTAVDPIIQAGGSVKAADIAGCSPCDQAYSAAASVYRFH